MNIPLNGVHMLITTRLPPDIVEAMRDGFREAKVETELKQYPSSPMAALEDYIPAAVSLFLFKPFIDAFMKKAGEDGYALFKKALLRSYSIARTLKIEIITSSDSPKKIQNSPYSRSFAIYYATESGRRVKFLFLAESTEEQADAAVSAMLTYIKKDRPESESEPSPTALKASSGVSLMYFDHTSNAWKKRIKIL